MQKTCATCDAKFDTRDSRVKTCSTQCGYVRSSKTLRSLVSTKQSRTVDPTVYAKKTASIQELPDVNDLPAVYLKRAHDLWSSLIGSTDYRRRID